VQRQLLSLAFCVSVLGVTAPASSQSPPDSRTLFQEGRDAAKRGDYKAAAAKFKQSFALDPKPGTLLNIADSEEHLGRIAAAYETYLKVLGLLKEGDERLPMVNERVETLRTKIARVRVTGALPPGARVTRDGEEIPAEKIDKLLPVDPGGHIFVVSAPGKPERRFEIVLAAGEQRDLSYDATDAAKTATGASAGAPSDRPTSVEKAPEQKESPPTSPSGRKTTALVVGGIGGVALITSAVTGAMVLSRKATMKDHCDASFSCDGDGLGAASSGKTLSTVSTVSFLVGVAGVGAGAYLYLSDDTSVSASATGSGAAVRVGGRF
jgi:hypothetical protein